MARTVLFSDKEIASYISREFEPVWESLRPAPQVTIDFGEGRTIKRTLNGNIATYICLADGQIVDVLPGIYEPSEYLAALKEIQQVSAKVQNGVQPVASALAQYHRESVSAIYNTPSPASFRAVSLEEEASVKPRFDMSKMGIEMPLKKVISTRTTLKIPGTAQGSLADNLIADSMINERERRVLIHQKLAAQPPTLPKELHRWLYKEVLHVDLDDPYLGLRPQLGETYPWAE